ncbi:MAG: redox-sensing transcriptional repressor Rex [bacterium]|nr:redox-sensing transcriptional repressor Rex [bacterium]
MKIPDKVINRLTLYHYILDDYENEFISSTKIAELLDIDNSQVRKDIKYLNNSGKCRVGYDVKTLKQAIESELGFKNHRSAFIIGAGNLGSALAKYDNFKDYGLDIKAMFDNDTLRVGNTVNGKEVYHVSELPKLVKKMNVDIAILTVPKVCASETAKYLVNSGIKYIWNFTTCILDVSGDVKVWNENLIGNFIQFTHENDV